MNSIRAAKPEYSIRARVDDETEHPRTLAKRIYNEQFLSKLKEQFGFDALEPQVARELQGIAFRYIVFRRGENQPQFVRKSRLDYRALQKATERYIEFLEHFNEEMGDLASDIHLAVTTEVPARVPVDCRRPINSRRPTDRDGHASLAELLRLLSLMKMTAGRHVRDFTAGGGRPKNLGLEAMTWKAAEFWTEELKRKFTVDYHRGTGITEAFEFVRALVAPLDDVSDRQIVTAMRAEINRRGLLECRTLNSSGKNHRIVQSRDVSP